MSSQALLEPTTMTKVNGATQDLSSTEEIVCPHTNTKINDIELNIVILPYTVTTKRWTTNEYITPKHVYAFDIVCKTNIFTINPYHLTSSLLLKGV